MNLNRSLTRGEVIHSIFSIVILIVPILLLVVFPENELIQLLLGSGKLFILWVLVIIIELVFKKGIKVDNVQSKK